jgi:hypothetical protein
MTECRTGNPTEPVGVLIRFYSRAMAQAIALGFLLLPTAHADIYSKFREDYSGQGYIIDVADGGRTMQIKLIGQVTTTNRTVAIIRTKPDLWIATGRLLSNDLVLSGTQRVERIAGTVPAKRGDVAFLAPRQAGDESPPPENTPEPKKPIEPTDDADVTNAHVALESKSGLLPDSAPHLPHQPTEGTSTDPRQDFDEWRQDLFAAPRDSLTREWISRLDNAIQSWTHGNDYRVRFCVTRLGQLEGTQEPAYLLLLFEYHIKTRDFEKARKDLAGLDGHIDAKRLDDLGNQLKELTQ